MWIPEEPAKSEAWRRASIPDPYAAMGASPEFGKTQLTTLLIKLNRDRLTGRVTVKDNRRFLRIYLRGGHVVSADGMDVESRLIKEIVQKKRLPASEVTGLAKLRERDPSALGRALVDRGVVSQEAWNRFLVFKVKQILAVAIQMTNAELGFSETPVDIPPLNRIDYNLFQLLVETVKGLRNEDLFQSRVPGPEAVLEQTLEAESVRKQVLLSPSEERVLGLVDGRRRVGDIQAESGLDASGVLKTLFLLLCFGMVEPLERAPDGDGADIEETVHLYLDLLKIIEANFQKEVGKQFEKVFSECLNELGSRSGALFEPLRGSRASQEDLVQEISARFREGDPGRDGELFLKSSFNKLVFLLLMRMKRVLGIGLVEKTIQEMRSILDYVEKYRQDTEMMNYIKGNLQDYLRRIKG